MQPVQLVLTDELAGLAAAAADVAIRAHQSGEFIEMNDDELTDMQRLAVFFAAVASDPASFPLRGQMATSIKKLQRRARAPQTAPTKAEKPTQGKQKRDRAQRRADVAEYNRARAVVEQDMTDRDAYLAERRAQLESEPKFDVTDLMGNVVLQGVPASMIRPNDVAVLDEQSNVIHLPTGVEV